MMAELFCARDFMVAKINGFGKEVKAATRSLDATRALCHFYAMAGDATALLQQPALEINLALVAVLCEMKLSKYDTVAYLSISAFLILMPFCLIQKQCPVIG